jgi:hypothetical protein
MCVIKVGYLISYDYEFVKISLPRVYNFVAEIILAVDLYGKTWSGQDIEISNDFWSWIAEFDKEHKIIIYKDEFFIPGLSPMECDTRERNLLGQKMGICDWYIQIDSDEYFVDFEAFVKRLSTFDTKEPTSVYCSVVTLFKQLPMGFLLIDKSFETLSFATNNPVYDLARNNTSGNKHIYWNDLVLHQSWARTDQEIILKLANWSHKNDFNTESFYKLWSAVDEHNYYCLSNFHPLTRVTWAKLIMIEGGITDILNSDKLHIFRSLPGGSEIKKKNLLSKIWKAIRSK